MAGKTSGDFEKEFIETAKAATGKTLAEWFGYLKSKAMPKRNDIIAMLKVDHGLNHMQAQLLTGIYLNGGKPVYIDEDNLMESHFIKFASMRELYNSIEAKLLEDFPGSKVIPKKTYISFTDKREFAAMNIKDGEIRLGMDLGDMPFDNRVSKTKLAGPMPRISHMAILKKPNDYDAELQKLLSLSYNRCH